MFGNMFLATTFLKIDNYKLIMIYHKTAKDTQGIQLPPAEREGGGTWRNGWTQTSSNAQSQAHSRSRGRCMRLFPVFWTKQRFCR